MDNLETLKFAAMLNKKISDVVLKNAPENHKLIAPSIQKDITQTCADLTVKAIVDDIGDDYFALLVDEAHTTARSLKAAIDRLFSKLGLSLSKCRGQCYDGASNMSSKFNGLKSLILANNKSAYYIHCFAHQLQLALIKVAKHHRKVQEFFDMLQKMATVVRGSCKRKDSLRDKQYELIVQNIASGETTTGIGLNQETTLKRPGDTRWGSYYATVGSVTSLFSPLVSLMNEIEEDPDNTSART
ncbi:zinc finger MYM-type protein 1-like [Canna indica]|uniref:Zinc finger MYM-type protein 1-like n=1 Tax=Canna indica TaxID=4628 RepID=A0AAQ3Q5U7_9LILI|nr:zinc finger MYM-type protein 1-like [Canna indica]